jgi:5-methylcytosine-specific restriction endonuclease McrA
MSDVLVLSKTWEAYDRVSWERAFVLLCGGDDGKKKVEVVEYDEEKKIHSGSNTAGELREWKVPSVIRFVDAVTPQIKVVKFSRENIYTRDKGACQYCGTKVKQLHA